MKIAMIGHKRVPSREGGVEVVVEELATRMVKLGHTVHVFNRKGHHVSGKAFDENHNSRSIKNYNGIQIFTIFTIQNANLNAFLYSLFASVRALFGRYDIIHFHAEGACAMLWLPHVLGIRTVATIHGLDWQRSKWGGFAARYLKFGEKIAARYADEVIVLSLNAQQYFYHTYNRKTWFIPNGIHKPEVRCSNLIKDKFGIDKDTYILFLGRIVPEKGLHYLIDAFKVIDTSFNLVIAGGSSHTNAYMEENVNNAKDDKRIIFTDFVHDEVLAELFSNAYVYVLPSDIEGMPISLLEAMSYGNCCLVSDIAENMEVIDDKAISFKKGNINDLKEKLIWLINNPLIVEYYKQMACGYICNKYSWIDVVEETIQLYELS